MRDAAIGRAPTMLQNNLFNTRISNFVFSPILSATATARLIDVALLLRKK